MTATKKNDVVAGAMAAPSMAMLTGFRILEVGGYLAAPFATAILQHYGAEVIKVESLTGDPFRGDLKNWASVNAGKKSIAVDMKSIEGKTIFASLVRSSHAVIQNLTSATADRLGVTYEHCRRIKADIVYGDINGFGPGPYSGRPATNPIIESLTGVMTPSGPENKPTRQAIPVYDQMAGALIAQAVSMRLLSPSDDFTHYFDASLFETGLFQRNARFAEADLFAGAPPTDIMATAPYDTFRTADDTWMFVGVASDHIWRRFCTTLGLADMSADPRYATVEGRGAHKFEINQQVQQRLAGQRRHELLDLLHSAGVPSAPVYSFDKVLQDEHLRAGKVLTQVRFRDRDVMQARFPVNASQSDYQGPSPKLPVLGQESRELLCELGYPPEDAEALIRKGILRSEQ